RQDLNNTMGLPIETVFDPVPVDILPVPSDGADSLVSTAMVNRPELEQSKLLVAALEMTAQVATQDMKPALNITAQHVQYFDSPAGTQQKLDQFGAKLSGPLYDSGVGRNKVQAARRDVEQAKIQQEQIALAVALSVRNAVTNAFTALTNRDLAQKNVDLAKETVRIAQLRYDEGAGILLDVIVVQADYTSAQANLVNANYRYLQAFAQLQRAVGSDDLRARPTTNPQDKKK
ncbi:MAG: TolC family protein, partial [Armatimonadota bacterium]